LPGIGTTPGTSVANPNMARPLFAMFSIVSLPSANARSPLLACSSLTRATTLTLSLISPTSRVTIPAENLSFALTTTLVRSSVLKPGWLTRSV
jgi:hypothetical protein